MFFSLKTTVIDYNTLESRDTIAISGHKCETSGEKTPKTTVLNYNKFEARDTMAISGH
jgi:hypothetical protein